MILFRNTIFAVVAALLCGCSAWGDDGYVESGDSSFVDVVLAVESVSSRTELDPTDLATVRWSLNDEVALWADPVDSGDGSTLERALEGECFTLRYYSTYYSRAEFSASISPMDSDKEYTYRAFYPYNDSVDGDNITYVISTSQSGLYDGKYDFRVAEDVVGSALSESTMGECSLSFGSIMHALKISIPYGYNNLGTELKALRVTFPDAVAGSVTYNMADGTSTLADDSNIITLDFDTPFDEGDDSVWLFMKPISDVTGSILITGIGVGNEVAYDYEIPLTNHTFSAGHITPVYTAIGDEIPATKITIELGDNNLGEGLTNINLTAPEGAIFTESGSNEVSVEADDEGHYTVSYLTPYYQSYFDGATLDVVLETEHTLIPTTGIAMSDVTTNGETTFTRDLPYLLEENFTSIKTFSSKDNFDTGFGKISGSADDLDLSGSTYGLSSGWEANRAGASAGYSIRICCREEATVLYEGWLKTPTFSYIKEDVTVVINVNYDYGGGTSYWGSNVPTPQYNINSDGTYEQGTDSSFTDIKHNESRQMLATNTDRFEWGAYVSRGSALLQNSNNWLYIDNVKVTIYNAPDDEETDDEE